MSSKIAVNLLGGALMFYNLKALLSTPPGRLGLLAIIFFTTGTCIGILLFAPPTQADIFLSQYDSINPYVRVMVSAFSNPCSIILDGYAVVMLILALFKYALWRYKGLLQAFPAGTVLWHLDHISSIDREYHFFSKTTTITTHYYTQPALFVFPQTGCEYVTVVCGSCQQALQFRVDNPRQRKVRRIRRAFVSILLLALAIALIVFANSNPAFFSSSGSTPLSDAGLSSASKLLLDPGLLLAAAFIVLFFSGTIGLWHALQYSGVSCVKRPRWHRARRFPRRDELENCLAALREYAPPQP